MMDFDSFIKFTDSEKENILELFKTTVEYTPKREWDWGPDAPNSWHSLFDENHYFEMRMKNRKESLSPTLSKKEKVVCKLNMILELLNVVQMSFKDSGEVIDKNILQEFVLTLKTEVFSGRLNDTSGEYPKFKGIPIDAANLLNVIYQKINFAFQKKYLL